MVYVCVSGVCLCVWCMSVCLLYVCVSGGCLCVWSMCVCLVYVYCLYIWCMSVCLMYVCVSGVSLCFLSISVCSNSLSASLSIWQSNRVCLRCLWPYFCTKILTKTKCIKIAFCQVANPPHPPPRTIYTVIYQISHNYVYWINIIGRCLENMLIVFPVYTFTKATAKKMSKFELSKIIYFMSMKKNVVNWFKNFDLKVTIFFSSLK